VAPERKRSARDYEQALRRQELAAGRALVQALGAEGPPGARELAAARRVLTQALFELRRLGRDLDQGIEGLRARHPGPARPTPVRGAGPGELDRFEALRGAVEEVAERWEGRRDQLSAELDRRQPRHGRRPGQPRQQPGQRGGGTRDRREVSGRRGGAPVRPERPRSPRSRRSPG
jgi:HAMP domain-containing protein